MAKKGRDIESTWRPNEADKRLAQYKKTIKQGLSKYGDSKQKFVSKMAQFMLAEVRNERKLMTELADDLRATYDDFTTTTDED